jgi:hypothetical protein
VLQRQREQTSDAAAEFLRRHYRSSQASHAADDEQVSELDQRLRLIEQVANFMKLFWKNDLIMPLNTSKSNFIVQITHLK